MRSPGPAPAAARAHPGSALDHRDAAFWLDRTARVLVFVGGISAILFIAAILLLMLLWQGIEMITDWFWFQEVGYEKVFTVTFFTRGSRSSNKIVSLATSRTTSAIRATR